MREGAGGGGSHKQSIVEPAIERDLRTFGEALGWHGAVTFDAILTDEGPAYIDVNPRLVEPANAWHAGVDLPAALLEVARGAPVRPAAPGRPAIRTTPGAARPARRAGPGRGVRRAAGRPAPVVAPLVGRDRCLCAHVRRLAGDPGIAGRVRPSVIGAGAQALAVAAHQPR